MTLELSIANGKGEALHQARDEEEVFLVARHAYVDGDVIELSSTVLPAHLEVTLDAAMPPARIYLAESPFRFAVPFGLRRKAYPPQAFLGDLQRLACRLVPASELTIRRNLAFNPYDDHGTPRAFPHAFANVETRGEAVFAARNAIDGEKANSDHGFWPFTSWGINRDPDATLTVDFGRDVLVDEIAFYLRADFPHDAWWQRVSVTFSTDETRDFALTKSGARQSFALPETRLSWLRLHSLIKADDPSPFPALTQIEVLGRDG